jgi:hypothetical protein
MKKLSWVQLILGVLIVGALSYVLWWSRTGLIDKLEGPAFANQSDASRWVALHPAFVTFARWYIPFVVLFGLAVLVVGILQVKRGDSDLDHPIIIQIVTGCLIALSAFIILMAVKPSQFALSTGQGALQLGYTHSMWREWYAVVDFIVIILGLLVAAVGIVQQTLYSRAAAPVVAKPGWKSARNATRRRR